MATGENGMNAIPCEFGAVSVLRQESLSKIEQLRLNGQLPSPKGVALTIMELCRQEDVTTEAIARVVQTDPALTGRLLRLANSAAANVGRPIAAIPDAIMRLGLSTVRQVAMGFSLVDQYQEGPCKAFDYERFWSHSLLMAVAMRALGSLGRIGAPDELFVCGLMARMGCLALATVHPVEYGELLQNCTDDAQLLALECQHLQADHNDFTAAILCDCGMPKALVEPVYYHEAPESSGFTDGSRPHQLVHLLYHAKRLADMALATEAERTGILSELMLLGGKLGMDANDLGDLVDGIVGQWREWGELLKVKSNALPSFAAMVAAPAPKVEAEPMLYPPMRVLLVEDDPTTRVMMEAVLAGMVGRQVFTASDGREALAMAVEVLPQIVVTDWLMPVMDGIELTRALRATDWGQSMYVIMLTGVDTEEEVVLAFEAGVDDYVTKPVNMRSLRARMRAALHYVQLLEAWERDRAQLKQFAAELAISNRKMEHYALTDLLTNLPNRRAGMDRLTQAWSAATRFEQGLAVMMVDIDRFKGVNDTHGHAVGDKVLAEVGRLIRVSARKDDYVCRTGGEEFLVICQNTDLKSSVLAAERLRQKIGSARIGAGKVELQTTISIGVAFKEADMPDADSLVAAADRALYAAKQGGRNRTCFSFNGKLSCGPA
jgi:two-component system, cell cycle response regulator